MCVTPNEEDAKEKEMVGKIIFKNVGLNPGFVRRILQGVT